MFSLCILLIFATANNVAAEKNAAELFNRNDLPKASTERSI